MAIDRVLLESDRRLEGSYRRGALVLAVVKNLLPLLSEWGGTGEVSTTKSAKLGSPSCETFYGRLMGSELTFRLKTTLIGFVLHCSAPGPMPGLHAPGNGGPKDAVLNGQASEPEFPKDGLVLLRVTLDIS